MEPIEDTPHPRNRHIYLLPNLLTTCGLFSGFYAILAAASGHFDHACMAMFVAGVFDGVDGRVARMTGTSSEFGVQYDSLADLVSFGMAPALVMYHWALVGMKRGRPAAGQDRLGRGVPLRGLRGVAAGALQHPGRRRRQALVHRPEQPVLGRG